MSTSPPQSPLPAEPGPRAWLRPLLLVAACLVLGFVGGWIVRGDEGTVTVLPAGPSGGGAAGEAPAPGGATAPSGTGGVTVTAPEEPAPPPDREDITLVVLNATSQSGYAARVAGQAQSLGYNGVTASNAPASFDPTTAYFRPGQRPAAARVARDLRIGRILALPRTGALADASPAGTDVTVVLGPE